MQKLKPLVDFYINASIHVALAAVAFIEISGFYLAISIPKNVLFFVFFATVTGYNFVKYAGVAKLHHKRLTRNLKIIQIFSFACFIALCYFGFLLPLKTILFVLPFSVLTFLYAIPFLSGFHKNLRQISYLKIVVVAFVWAGFTVLIPAINSGLQINLEVFLIGAQRFLISVALILPFDIRDVKYDAISLQTIPKKIGIQKTKKLGLLLMLLALFLEYAIHTELETKNAFMLFFFVSILFIMRAKIDQSKYYSSFWVELIPVLWWGFLFGIHNL